MYQVAGTYIEVSLCKPCDISLSDNMKPAVIAKLSCQCEELYSEALKALQKELLKPLWERDWTALVC